MLRLAVIDNDQMFARQVAAEIAMGKDWRFELFGGGPPPSPWRLARFDAVLVDPAAIGDGFWRYLEEVAGQLPDLCVLVCGSRTDVASRVRGLRSGADDWIAKPSSPTEILARAEAFRRARRVKAPGLEEPVLSGEIEIRPGEADARAGRVRLGLTGREFELLRFLVREEGKVLARETIYRRVWGYRIPSGDRSVYTYIRRLRIKLEVVSPDWVYIHTHLGTGYRFEPEPVALAPEKMAVLPAPSAVGTSHRLLEPVGA